MIFVTVGTHEQPFDRLLKAVDDVAEAIPDELFYVQKGCSTYRLKYCKSETFINSREMAEVMRESRITICHGGPSSFMPLVLDKRIPIVVPRKSEFGEHVNNHQVEFVRFIYNRTGGILPIYDTDDLFYHIINYEKLTSTSTAFRENKADFCDSLNKIVRELMNEHSQKKVQRR